MAQACSRIRCFDPASYLLSRAGAKPALFQISNSNSPSHVPVRLLTEAPQADLSNACASQGRDRSAVPPSPPLPPHPPTYLHS